MPHKTQRTACPEDLYKCEVCAPVAPDDLACIVSIDLNVVKLLDDIRVEVNGEPIIDARWHGIGNYSKIIDGAKHKLKEGDVITLKAFAAGATYCIGTWYAAVKYARAGGESVITFRDVNDTAPRPVTPGQEYYQFAQFTI